jgi:hypothetical protein
MTEETKTQIQFPIDVETEAGEAAIRFLLAKCCLPCIQGGRNIQFRGVLKFYPP